MQKQPGPAEADLVRLLGHVLLGDWLLGDWLLGHWLLGNWAGEAAALLGSWPPQTTTSLPTAATTTPAWEETGQCLVALWSNGDPLVKCWSNAGKYWSNGCHHEIGWSNNSTYGSNPGQGNRQNGCHGWSNAGQTQAN